MQQLEYCVYIDGVYCGPQYSATKGKSHHKHAHKFATR